MKNNFYKVLTSIVLFLFCLPFTSLAQGPGDGGVCDTCEEQVPLDNWLIFLLIAGTIYGLLKLRKYNKQIR